MHSSKASMLRLAKGLVAAGGIPARVAGMAVFVAGSRRAGVTRGSVSAIKGSMAPHVGYASNSMFVPSGSRAMSIAKPTSSLNQRAGNMSNADYEEEDASEHILHVSKDGQGEESPQRMFGILIAWTPP